MESLWQDLPCSGYETFGCCFIHSDEQSGAFLDKRKPIIFLGGSIAWNLSVYYLNKKYVF